MHTAGGVLLAGMGGGNAFAGAAGAGAASALAGNLNQVSNAVYDSNPTGDADANRALGNILANALAGVAGAAVGGNSGAVTGTNADLYNRSTSCNGAHCDGSNAIGKSSDPLNPIRVDLVSRYCGAGNVCTDAQLKEVLKAQGELSQAVNRGAMGAVEVGGGAAVLAAAAIAGPETIAAYKAAQAGYSLYTAALTGASVSAGSYTFVAAASAAIAKFQGADAAAAFDQHFSLLGLGAATTVGAANGVFGASMFKWADIPNKITNVSTVPGVVIRLNGFFQGQAAGKAAQAAVNQYEQNR